MGNSASIAKTRYIGGKTFLKYFKDEIWPIHGALLDGLGLNETRSFKLFRAFAVMDENENAQVDSKELFRFFQPSRNKLSERLFYCEKQEGSGAGIRRGFTFKEFAVLLWSFCTLTNEGLARYIFEIFDVDNNYILSRSHVEAMFRMLYDTAMVDQQYIDLYPYAHDQSISKAQFIEFTGKKPVLIRPAMTFQRLLRKKTLGVALWTLLTQFRATQFRVFDHDCDRLFEAEEAIVRSIENQALENARPTAEQILELTEAQIQRETEAVQRELNLRQREQQLERRRSAVSAPDVAMKRAWAALEARRKAFEAEEFTTSPEDVQKRRTWRLELFDLHEHAVEVSQAYFLYKDQRDMSIAEGSEQDHEARFADFVAGSQEGKQVELLGQLYEIFKLMKEEIDEKNKKDPNYNEEKKSNRQVLVENNFNALQKLADPILFYDASSVSLEELDKRMLILTRRDFSEEIALSRKLAKQKQIKLGESRAHTFLVQFFKAKTIRKAKEDIEKARESRRREWIKGDWELQTKYGSHITEWEYVLDKDSNKPVYVSSRTGQRRHPKTAFCEKCDAVMIQNEMRCVQCDAPRSAKNMLLYRPLGFKDITLE